MLFTSRRREWEIRRTLRKLGRQRVALVLQPHNVWVIENAVPDDEDTDAMLKTCHMRGGGVEPLEHAVPRGQLTPEGALPQGNVFTVGRLYRLTDSGWAVINRSQQMAILGLFLD